MIITKEIVTTKVEKITVRIEDSKAEVILDKKNETDAISAILQAAEKTVSLNSKCDGTPSL